MIPAMPMDLSKPKSKDPATKGNFNYARYVFTVILLAALSFWAGIYFRPMGQVTNFEHQQNVNNLSPSGLQATSPDRKSPLEIPVDKETLSASSLSIDRFLDGKILEIGDSKIVLEYYVSDLDSSAKGTASKAFFVDGNTSIIKAVPKTIEQIRMEIQQKGTTQKNYLNAASQPQPNVSPEPPLPSDLPSVAETTSLQFQDLKVGERVQIKGALDEDSPTLKQIVVLNPVDRKVDKTVSTGANPNNLEEFSPTDVIPMPNQPTNRPPLDLGEKIPNANLLLHNP
jgi:hypothetical protein